MDALKAGGVILSSDKHTTSISPHSWPIRSVRKGKDGFVSDGAALDEANSLQLGEQRESLDRLVRQEGAASKVDVADSVTTSYQPSPISN